MTQPKVDHMVGVRTDSIQRMTLDGVDCFAFTVRPGDVMDFDRVEGNRGPNGQFNERAEISCAPAQGTLKYQGKYNVKEGMLQTYDVDYRFAAGFPAHVSANHEWAVLTQYHPQDDTRSSFKGFGGATFHDGAITFDNPSGDGSAFAKVPIKPDTWYRIRMVVKWAADQTGWAKIVDRATGKLLGRYDGPTIAAGEFKYGPMQGYYRAGGLPQGTVYQSSPTGPLIDIADGDLSEVVPVPAPLDAGATQLAAMVAQLRPALATASKALDDAQAFLDKLK